MIVWVLLLGNWRSTLEDMTDHVLVVIIVYTQEVTSVLNPGTLTFLRRNNFFNFSTPCI